MFVTKMLGIQRQCGGGHGRNWGRCHNNHRQEEDFQGWQNINEIAYNAFLDPNNIQNIQFTKNIPQTSMFPQC